MKNETNNNISINKQTKKLKSAVVNEIINTIDKQQNPQTLSMKLRTQLVNAETNPPRIMRNLFPKLSNTMIESNRFSNDMFSTTLSPIKSTNSKPIGERLSGLFDSMAIDINKYDIYPDYNKMTNPTTLCVRCGSIASLCMECNEYQINETINFYKLSRAEGANVFFNKAIIRSSDRTITRFIIFTIWKNYIRLNRYINNKKFIISSKKYRISHLLKPFREWRRIAKYQRMNKYLTLYDELKLKFDNLEKYLNKIRTDKTNDELQISHLTINLQDREKILQENDKEILQLKYQLALERDRVSKVCSFLEPLQLLNDLIVNRHVPKTTTSNISNMSTVVKAILNEPLVINNSDNQTIKLDDQKGDNVNNKVYNNKKDLNIDTNIIKTYSNDTVDLSINLTPITNKSSKVKDNIDVYIHFITNNKSFIIKWLVRYSYSIIQYKNPYNDSLISSYLPSISTNSFDSISRFDDLSDGKILLIIILGILLNINIISIIDLNKLKLINKDNQLDIHETIKLFIYYCKTYSSFDYFNHVSIEDIYEGNINIITKILSYILKFYIKSAYINTFIYADSTSDLLTYSYSNLYNEILLCNHIIKLYNNYIEGSDVIKTSRITSMSTPRKHFRTSRPNTSQNRRKSLTKGAISTPRDSDQMKALEVINRYDNDIKYQLLTTQIDEYFDSNTSSNMLKSNDIISYVNIINNIYDLIALDTN